MDPAEILNVRFHFGGHFIRIGPSLDYVGGETGMSEIERDKLSLQEVKGFLKDHMELKESMKFYFHIPGTELVDGLVFLDDDSKCVQMGDYICVGAVAHIYVEYHGEQDSADSSSCSDFADELVQLSDAPPAIVTAEATDSEEEVQVVENVTAEASDSEEVLANVQNIMVPDDTGVISQIIVSPVKQRR